MQSACNILILGASYGSLLAAKLLLAGHNVTLVCRSTTAELINRNGIRVRMPVAGGEKVEIDSRDAPGRLSAAAPSAVDPKGFDLVALAMQEPQYGGSGIPDLLARIAKAKVPCMSLMNMPPLPYL
ncbi:2-dehydropantoate 2-reductase N-terminal domain-containing protein, partial [Microvirga massiliensis]|uniref:2-dehydropantoate 2-reductase N-terminal domain-containing protein n=1 Tax=Microvirga massiliensis TaxID=1033741 RepID=UPI00062B43BE